MSGPERLTNISITNNTILRLILWGAFVLVLWKLWNLVLILLTAIVLASFIHAVADKFAAKLRFPRMLSVILMYILSIGAIGAVFYFFVPILLRETISMFSLLAQYINPSQLPISSDATSLVTTLSNKSSNFSDLLLNSENILAQLSGGVLPVVSGAFGGILNIILIIILSFYLSIQERGIEKFLRLVTPAKDEEYVVDLWQRTRHKIALWVRGQLILGLIVAILTFLALLFFKVKYALVLAIIAGLFELIPFGIILAAVPAISFAYVDGGLTLALLVALLYFTIHQIENYFIQPYVVKRVIGISPLVVILSVLIGAELAGFWGIVLAVPVSVAFFEYVSDVENEKRSRLETSI